MKICIFWNLFCEGQATKKGTGKKPVPCGHSKGCVDLTRILLKNRLFTANPSLRPF